MQDILSRTHECILIPKPKIRHLKQKRFKPEFLNRLDEYIIFHPLKRDTIRLIVDQQVVSNHILIDHRPLVRNH